MILKQSGAYASENSLKLKLKLNSAGQLVNANTLINNSTETIKQEAEKKKPKAKEILVFDKEKITEIKVDNEPTIINNKNEELKPLKLKLKLNSDNNMSLYSVATPDSEPPKKDSTIKIDPEYEREIVDSNDDDELLNELKNSYQDNDYGKIELKSRLKNNNKKTLKFYHFSLSKFKYWNYSSYS
jgi:hypothetical protein